MAEPVSTSVGVFAGLKAFAPAVFNFLISTAATSFGVLMSVYIYRDRKWWEHGLAWPMALGLSYWVVGGVAEYFSYKEGFFLHALGVFTGTFGVSILMQVAQQLPLAADGARVKWFGGAPKVDIEKEGTSK